MGEKAAAISESWMLRIPTRDLLPGPGDDLCGISRRRSAAVDERERAGRLAEAHGRLEDDTRAQAMAHEHHRGRPELLDQPGEVRAQRRDVEAVLEGDRLPVAPLIERHDQVLPLEAWQVPIWFSEESRHYCI